MLKEQSFKNSFLQTMSTIWDRSSINLLLYNYLVGGPSNPYSYRKTCAVCGKMLNIREKKDHNLSKRIN